MNVDLYDRFCEDLRLRGYAERSRQSYRRSVRQLQQFCSKSLEEITEEEVRAYWVCCRKEFKWSTATLRISYSGIKHFYTFTVKRDWALLSEVKFEREQTLPTVLSIDEVRTIPAAFPPVQNHAYFATVYSLGLRLTEGLTLQVRDIDSDRMVVHVHAGKGRKDRMVPLPEARFRFFGATGSHTATQPGSSRLWDATARAARRRGSPPRTRRSRGRCDAWPSG